MKFWRICDTIQMGVEEVVVYIPLAEVLVAFVGIVIVYHIISVYWKSVVIRKLDPNACAIETIEHACSSLM